MESARQGGPRKGAGRRPGTPTKVVRLPVPIADVAHRLATRGLRMGDISAMYALEQRSDATVPLMMSRAACGFPSPADDYLDRPLDFNELLVKNPPATFAVRVEGLSMRDAGILPGDIAVIDRALSPTPGCIVMAVVAGEFTIKRYLKRGDQIILHPENPNFPDIVVTEGMDFEIWGVLTSSLHMF